MIKQHILLFFSEDLQAYKQINDLMAICYSAQFC